MVLSLNGVTKPAWANGGPDGLPVETVLTAVETAIMMAGQDEQNPPTMRFHRESGLLIVKGTPEQLSTAGQVVESLSVDVRNAARKSVGESQVRTYPSLHTPAEELAEVVRYVFPPEASGENRVELSIAAEQNGLVVKAPAEWQNAVAAAIRAADRRRVPDAEAERRTLQLEAMAQELMNARKMAEDSQSQGLEMRARLAEFQAMKEAMDKQMNAAAEEADRFRAMMDKRDAESRQLAHERDTLMAAVRELQAQLKASGGATAPK
jgi:type II secretory pathway component GspD/PulD (secretin)